MSNGLKFKDSQEELRFFITGLEMSIAGKYKIPYEQIEEMSKEKKQRGLETAKRDLSRLEKPIKEKQALVESSTEWVLKQERQYEKSRLRGLKG